MKSPLSAKSKSTSSSTELNDVGSAFLQNSTSLPDVATLGADAFVYGALFGDAGDDYILDYEQGVDLVSVEIGFGISNFSEVTLSDGEYGAVASFDGVFGGSITSVNMTANQISEDDFLFFI